MAVHSFEDLIPHVGHEIVCVTYGDEPDYGDISEDQSPEEIAAQVEKADADAAINVAIECETCGCVLVDFDRLGNYHD